MYFLLFVCLMWTQQAGAGAGLLRLSWGVGYGILVLSEDCGEGRIMTMNSASWARLQARVGMKAGYDMGHDMIRFVGQQWKYIFHF